MAAPIRRPEAVRLMGRTFLINYVKGSVLADQHDFGHIDYYSQVINVADNLTPVEEADTVLHELIHAIDLSMGLEMTEHQVHHLATGLIALLQDNPELGSYLTEDKFEKLVKDLHGSNKQRTRGSTRASSQDPDRGNPKGEPRQRRQQGTKRCNP